MNKVLDEGQALAEIEFDVKELARSKKYTEMHWEDLVEACMRLWQVNPKDHIGLIVNRYNDYIDDYFDRDVIQELLDMYCKISLDVGDSVITVDLKEEIEQQFNTALVKLYGARVNEWFQEALIEEYVPDYDDIGD